MTYIYKHTSPSGLNYIGITKQNPTHRWLNGDGYMSNPKFYCAILLWGWEAFTHEIIEMVEDDIADEREQYWAEHYNSNVLGYNLVNKHPIYGENPARVYFDMLKTCHFFGKAGQKPKKEHWEKFRQSKWFKWKNGEEYDAWLRKAGENVMEENSNGD